MSSTDLAPRQADVLAFFRRYLQERGVPPTYREVGDALKISSTNGVSDHVKALIKKGYLEHAGELGAARSLRLAGARGSVVEVPLLRLNATWPLKNAFEGFIAVDAQLLPSGALVAQREGASVFFARLKLLSTTEVASGVCHLIVPRKRGGVAHLGPLVAQLWVDPNGGS